MDTGGARTPARRAHSAPRMHSRLPCCYRMLLVLVWYHCIGWVSSALLLIRAPLGQEALVSQAVDLYREAVSASGMGDAAHAIHLFQESIARYPLAPAYNNLGMLLFESETSAHCDQVLATLMHGVNIAREANDTETYVAIQSNIGHVVRSRNPRSVAFCLDAIRYFDLALHVDPLHVATLYNKASALYAIREYRDAERLFNQVLLLEPNHGATHLDLGSLFFLRGDMDLAIHHQDLAIANAKSLSERLGAMANKASFLKKEAHFAQALQISEEAYALAPERSIEISNLVAAKRVLCIWDHIEDLHDKLLREMEVELSTVAIGASLLPFDSTLLKLPDSFRKRLAIATAKRNEQPITLQLSPPKLTLLQPTPTRPLQRLKIGYLSYDFRDHPMGHLMLGFIENHNASFIEMLCYSYGPNDGSEWRHRAETGCDVFRDISAESDLEASQRIALDQVDLVIDLMVYTTGSRSGIADLKPSHIVVNYLGYPGTSGSSSTDYVIADRYVLPPERAKSSMTEQIVYLPHTYQANLYEFETPHSCIDVVDREPTDDGDAARESVEPCPLANRSSYGLPHAGLVFCNFNTINKFEPATFSAWMRILHQVPGSVLWLLEPSSKDGSTIMETLRLEAQAHGIHPSRIIFAAREEKRTHLARLTLADIFLDSFIYNAHSTASDALWANLPIVTLWGDAFPSRVAASLIQNAVPLPELIPHSVKEYEDLAIKLALNEALLQTFRREIASQALASPLFDSKRTTSNLETSYEVMHDLTHRVLPQCRSGKRFQVLVNPEASRDFDVGVNTDSRLQLAARHGATHHQLGRHQVARYYYHLVLQVHPNHPDALHLLGMLFFERGHFQPAMCLLGRVVREFPDVALFRLNTGIVYASLRDAENAVAEFKHVLRLDPSNAVAFRKLVEIYFRAQDFANAVQIFKSHGDSILSASSEINDEERELAYLQYSYALAMSGRSVDAIHFLEDVVEDHPTFFRAGYSLIGLYDREQMYRSAESRLINVVRAETHLEFRRRGVHFQKLARPAGKKVVVLYCHEYGQSWWGAWGPSSLSNGLGGSEEAVVFLSAELQKLGYWVEVYGDPPQQDTTRDRESTHQGVAWYPHYSYDPADASVDIFIAWRYHASLVAGQQARSRYLWLHDVPAEAVKHSDVLTSNVQGIFCLSEFHASLLPRSARTNVIVTSNGLDPQYFTDGPNHASNFVFGSAPSRGLDTVLRAWPRIRAAIPDAHLTIYYGFTAAFLEWGSKEIPQFARWKQEVEGLIETLPGVEYVGLVGHQDLAAGYSNTGFYLYPTTFSETSSVSLMKAMACGAIPITSRYQLSALPETCDAFDLGPRPLQSGNIDEDPEWIDLWVQSVVDAVRNDNQTRALRDRMKAFARREYRWSRVAEQWHRVFARSP